MSEGQAQRSGHKAIFDILAALTGYQRAAVLVACVRCGVVDALSEVPTPAAALAAELALDPGVCEHLLDALAQDGFIDRCPGGYRLLPDAGLTALSSGGALAHVAEKEALFARLWLDLDSVVASGAPLLTPWAQRLEQDPDQAKAFLEALVSLARTTGPDLTALAELGPGRVVVDVGGGLGSYAIPLAQAGAVVTLVDLPQVATWAADAAAGTPSCTVVACDVLASPSCGVPAGSADAVLVSHVLHDCTDEQADAVLAAAAGALRPGGSVVVNEFAGDCGPGAFGPLFALMMAVETGGRARPLTELVERLARAGFVRIRRAPYGDPVTVLVADHP